MPNPGKSVARVLLAGSLLSIAGLSEAATCSITLDHGLIKVDAVQVPRTQVFAELAHVTGLTIEGTEALSGTLSAQFSGATLKEAVHRLAGDASYTLVQSGDDLDGDGSSTELVFVTRSRTVRVLRSFDPHKEPRATVLVQDEETGLIQVQDQAALRGDRPATVKLSAEQVRQILEQRKTSVWVGDD